MEKTLALYGRIMLVLILVSIGSPSLAFGQVGGSTLGGEYGFGAIGRIGPPAAKIEVGVGIAPVLVFGTEMTQLNGAVITDETFVEIFLPVAVGSKVSLRVGGGSDEDRLGVKVGASYNSLLKFGFGGGVDRHLSERAVIAGGLMYYPEGDKELEKEISESRGLPLESVDIFLGSFRPFVSVSFLFL